MNYGSQNLTVPAAQVKFNASSNYTVFPPRTWIYEQSIDIIPQNYEVAFNSKHEAGHHYQYYQPPLLLADNAFYKQLVDPDFLYLDLKVPGNTVRSASAYWMTNYTSPDSRRGYEEMFAEQFALTAACSYITSASFPYPYLKADSTFYVYCGTNQPRFVNRVGQDNLMDLPTSTPPEWRQKFQYAGYAVYVFQDSAQALSILGAAAVPASAQAAGVLGFHQPQPIGNATTPFMAMFERVKQSNGTYVEHPNTNDLYNFDSGLYRESGRAIDRLAGSSGSAGPNFQALVNGDITHFNARNGCALSGTDSNLWGSLKSTICNTTTGVKKAPYVGVSNIAKTRIVFGSLTVTMSL